MIAAVRQPKASQPLPICNCREKNYASDRCSVIDEGIRLYIEVENDEQILPGVVAVYCHPWL